MASHRRIAIAPATLAILIAALAYQSSTLAADPVVNAGSIADSSPGESTTKSKRSNIDADVEKRANELVESHLPELRSLLEQLKTDSSKRYELAIRDLAKSARRLESAKNRDEELYKIEVELLKTQSSLKIHTAKLKVRDNESDRKALRKSAERLLSAEVARAKYNVRELAERAKRAQQQLSAANDRLKSLQEDSESQLEKKYNFLLRTAGRKARDADKPSRKSKQRNAKPPKD